MADQIIIDCPRTTIAPGEILRGEVLWDLEEDPEEIYLNLGWWTSGKGTRDEEITGALSWQAGRIGKEPFSLEVPDGPYSFSGRLISVEWGLECTAREGDARVLLPLVVSPSGREVDISAQSYESQIKSFSLRPR